jgi:hypothetical protein
MGEEDLDEVRARLAELPAEEWLGGTGPMAAAPETVDEEPAPEPEPEPDPKPEAARATPLTPGARRRRSVWPALLGLLLLAGVIVVIALAAGGAGGNGDEEGSGGATQAQSEETGGSTPPPEPEGHEGGVQFEPVGGGNADGRARLTDGGERIVVQVRGLPSPPNGGHYEVWLYSSLIESSSVGRSRQPVVQVDEKLPPDWQDYKFVDISVEAADGNAGHSGQSVARVRVDELSGQ